MEKYLSVIFLVIIVGEMMTEKSMKYEISSVRIRRDQKRWINKEGINLSKWVRNKIDKEMEGSE